MTNLIKRQGNSTSKVCNWASLAKVLGGGNCCTKDNICYGNFNECLDKEGSIWWSCKNIHDFPSCQRDDNLARVTCQDRHKLFCVSSNGSINYDNKYKNIRDNQRNWMLDRLNVGPGGTLSPCCFNDRFYHVESVPCQGNTPGANASKMECDDLLQPGTCRLWGPENNNTVSLFNLAYQPELCDDVNPNDLTKTATTTLLASVEPSITGSDNSKLALAVGVPLGVISLVVLSFFALFCWKNRRTILRIS